MSGEHHHPLASFALRPLNPRARAVVEHPSNRAFVSTFRDGSSGLDMGHIRSKAGDSTLATLGRGNADIILEGSNIAKIQCSFEINEAASTVMLYDRSHAGTTQVFGPGCIPFENGRPRKIVVQEELNNVFGMGGVRCDLIMFQLEWLRPDVVIMENFKSQAPRRYGEHPHLARTITDDADTVVASRRDTRIHTPGPGQLERRYFSNGTIGAGVFGEVHKVVDVDSGQRMAVKILRLPETSRESAEWKKQVKYLKLEVECLAKLSHPHIVDFIGAQGKGELQIEIFMGLKEGSLESLINSGRSPDPKSVFHQMLQALDCITFNGIIHRDVKPENILYTVGPNDQYHFQLADFGLCNRVTNAYSQRIGTPMFMAPEMWHSGQKSSKVDVWSLFVTMLWVLNVRNFRRGIESAQDYEHIQAMVLETSKDNAVAAIRRMADPNPTSRASAADMLLQHFNGEGLVTQRTRVLEPVARQRTEGRVDEHPIAGPSRRLTSRVSGRAATKLPGLRIASQSAYAQALYDEAQRQQRQATGRREQAQEEQLEVEEESPPVPGAFPRDASRVMKRRRTDTLNRRRW